MPQWRMPDKDDKNKGHTSEPQDYERNKKEVHEIEHDGKPSFKGVNDREANAARNTEHDKLKDTISVRNEIVWNEIWNSEIRPLQARISRKVSAETARFGSGARTVNCIPNAVISTTHAP